MTAPATMSRFAAFPSRSARWVASGVVIGLAVCGVVWRLGEVSVAVLTPAACVAVAAALTLFWADPRQLLPPAAAATAGVAVLGHATTNSIAWFAVCVIASWCALAGRRAEWLAYWTAATVLLAAEGLWVEPDPGWGAWIGGTAFAAVGSHLIRHEVDLMAQLRAAQAGLAERAMAHERNRIARELHDVIAHTLTVSLLHVSSARLAVEHDPSDAARALAEAERLGRESLAEVRAAVGLLREDGGTSSRSPLPGADQLPDLVGRSRLAGADVEFRARGDVAAIGPAVGLAVYRITQEALTNAMKHAPGARTVVELSVDDGSCRLEVHSHGEPGTGRGAGLATMRERAESVGGTLSAGPGGAGWRVCAQLPAAREAAT